MNIIERRKQNLGQGGFTLIELLVVIAILAILAGVAVFAIGGLTDTADENACQLEKDTFDNAVLAYRAQNGDYPAAAAEFIGDPSNPGLERDMKYFSVLYVGATTEPGLANIDDPAPDGKSVTPTDCRV